jgi:hypothetical protein
MLLRETLAQIVGQSMLTKTFAINDVSQGIDQIIHAPDESALNQLMRDLVRPLGATSHIFATLLRDDELGNRVNHRFLIGCKPQLCQFYNGRKLYMNDPCIIYAKSSTAPVAMHDLQTTTTSQRRFLEDTFPQWGFRSGLVIPAHSGVSNRIGVLYVGSEAAPPEGNATLMKHRVMLRAIAMELLDWWCARIRAEAIEKHQLLDIDLHILTLQKQGFTSTAIAEELHVSSRTIHNKIKRMKEAFQVDSIAAAIKTATIYGLIP